MFFTGTWGQTCNLNINPRYSVTAPGCLVTDIYTGSAMKIERDIRELEIQLDNHQCWRAE